MPPKSKQPTNAFGQQLPLSEDQDYLGKAIQGLLGAIGLGDDGGSTTTPSPLQRSNRGGQLVGAIPTELLRGLGIGATSLAPLISIYKTKAAREAATQEFLDSVRHFTNVNSAELPDQVKSLWTNAAEDFAARYPRVAAHARQSPTLTDYSTNAGRAGAAVDSPQSQVVQPLTLSLFDSGARAIEKNPYLASDIMNHEMTHVAQSLGNRDADALYWAADDVVGYQYNPFETSARLAGAKAVTGAPRIAKDPKGVGRKTIATALAHPAYQTKPEQERLMSLLQGAEQHGLWDLIPSQVNITPEKWPGAIPMTRKVAEHGLAQLTPKAQRGADTIKSILGMRERMPMTPTTEEVAKMPFLKRLARQMKSR